MTACVWDDLVGQTRVAGYLRAAVDSAAVSHAYLFVGPTGSGKKTAARALACALFCEDGGCGSCAVCRRVRAMTHPDLHVLAPEGVAEYLIAQIRGVIHDVHLKPIEAPYKVYVFDDVGRLKAEAANAFLKTLEEPPADVVIVLIADDYDDVLPTVASRCHVVRFSPVPTSTARALVVERTGASEDEARAALAAADNVISRAIELLRSPGRRNARTVILDVLKRLAVMDGHDVLTAARMLLAEVRAPVEDVKAAQSDELDEAREFLTKGGASEIEKRHKRELTAREREGITELLSVTESWLRDCLVMARGAAELVDNTDAADATAEIAEVLSAPAALRALDAVRTARQRIAYNVSPQLAVEAMLFDIQEVLRCPR
ncbi:MAG TPA: DNA polymerase III subunit delta' C-terminal domain-containing protein [Coriobacteriia bacterium]|nr:DNA polymerase III subunit delta' C-terminal domain-containing protein [Coriobacteriia bacterium]